jgi:hypothetical protein
MNSRSVRRTLVLAGLAALTAFWALAPGAGGQQAPPAGCALADRQPEEPLELNSVRVGNLVKTIAMQKEVFSCGTVAGSTGQVKDLETFVELVERQSKRDIVTVDRRVEVAECVKDLVGGAVRCSASNVPLGFEQAPLRGCSLRRGTYPFETIEQPRDPVAMNTVGVGKVVKTIKAEVETLDCRGVLADVYLFTEIIQAKTEARDSRNKKFWTVRPVAKRFDGVVCFKDEAAARVTRCSRFPTG